MKFESNYQKSIQENAFEHVAYKMVAIWSQPQYVNEVMAWFADFHLWVARSRRITACSIKFKQFNIGMILFNCILDCLVLFDWLVVDWLIEINPWPSLLMYCINSLALGRSGYKFIKSIFTLLLLIGILRSYDNSLRWVPQDLTNDQSTLVQVMAWCRQATSHYLS